MFGQICATIVIVHDYLLHQECAKTEGETCGYRDGLGACAPGFECDFSESDPRVSVDRGECKSKIHIIYYLLLNFYNFCACKEILDTDYDTFSEMNKCTNIWGYQEPEEAPACSKAKGKKPKRKTGKKYD